MAAPFAVEIFLIPVEQERVRAYGSPAAAVRIVFLASFLQFVVDPLSRNNDIFEKEAPLFNVTYFQLQSFVVQYSPEESSWKMDREL